MDKNVASQEIYIYIVTCIRYASQIIYGTRRMLGFINNQLHTLT
jgi:hypothetical protein